ncbi:MULTISPECIES: hypothetical protein [Campylobacter]|uniref:Uncharacterized protein n=1 Tax=Campylobacter lari TaxID=201 RepID=A0A7M1MHA7_CAMLA|nr:MULTISPECIES: hypothetical protein [Campylobacter]EGK7522620.1 hypothetical protein [Campylobacter lari]MCR8682865.1 hypothetical protein [Campylobacter sp. LMG 17559]MCR8705412.1 hypothetical protein [Campylobacter sp. 2352 PW]EGK8010108.1 hypothetical protein [Campylobacter lari]EGK8058247.1 hypothetical protein [Campylobacter lari]
MKILTTLFSVIMVFIAVTHEETLAEKLENQCQDQKSCIVKAMNMIN